ncbi:MAG: transposase, partial [Halanaerobiales bacterium]|nr:transposase [Halanaerobiales bacterium]
KITNGFIEGLNNKIKVIKRNGYGIPNFHNFKGRIFVTFYGNGVPSTK